ncbi:MAG TPA: acyloxyacyl hydrolase [Candidatus Saccharimonadales bacterium]|nr:acyloxyacyl hydrolase [Candidatus Saccharimonadales bacterium]
MKSSRLAFLALLIFGTVAAMAQATDDAAAIRREHWNFGVLASGGTGLIDRTNVQFIRAGVRAGRVMTGELGKGALRGTFEVDSEIMPLDYVLWSGYKNVYSLGINPLIMKWNFTAGKKAVPYFLTQGGVLWSTDHVPPGDTSKINFVTGAGVGMNYFIRPRRSVNWDVRATHLSNASLGRHNPGVNASLQFSIGYNWWKQ